MKPRRERKEHQQLSTDVTDTAQWSSAHRHPSLAQQQPKTPPTTSTHTHTHKHHQLRRIFPFHLKSSFSLSSGFSQCCVGRRERAREGRQSDSCPLKTNRRPSLAFRHVSFKEEVCREPALGVWTRTCPFHCFAATSSLCCWTYHRWKLILMRCLYSCHISVKETAPQCAMPRIHCRKQQSKTQ